MKESWLDKFKDYNMKRSFLCVADESGDCIQLIVDNYINDLSKFQRILDRLIESTNEWVKDSLGLNEYWFDKDLGLILKDGKKVTSIKVAGRDVSLSNQNNVDDSLFISFEKIICNNYNILRRINKGYGYDAAISRKLREIEKDHTYYVICDMGAYYANKPSYIKNINISATSIDSDNLDDNIELTSNILDAFKYYNLDKVKNLYYFISRPYNNSPYGFKIKKIQYKVDDVLIKDKYSEEED